jgi:hypothetical protein
MPETSIAQESFRSRAGVAFTMKQYVQTSLEVGREVANTLIDLITYGLPSGRE